MLTVHFTLTLLFYFDLILDMAAPASTFASFSDTPAASLSRRNAMDSNHDAFMTFDVRASPLSSAIVDIENRSDRPLREIPDAHERSYHTRGITGATDSLRQFNRKSNSLRRREPSPDLSKKTELIKKALIPSALALNLKNKRDSSNEASLPRQRRTSLLSQSVFKRLPLFPGESENTDRRKRSIPFEDAETMLSYRSAPRTLVKRDSTLITANCGPLGDRCANVSTGTCVTMCVNGETNKQVCKIESATGDSSTFCFVI